MEKWFTLEYTEEYPALVYFISLLTWLMLKMKEFLSDSHPKNLHPLFKTAGEFPPSFLNLKNQVTVTWVNLWIHDEDSHQTCSENFISAEKQLPSPFWGWKYTASSTSLRSNYIRNTCKTPTKYSDRWLAQVPRSFSEKNSLKCLFLPHPSLPKNILKL